MNPKQKFDPDIHHRRSIRLRGYDYSQAGMYFITPCCKEMKCRFGKIQNNEMTLNEFGAIAYNEWVKLPERFQNIELDVFQVMPNHMHGIIIIKDAGTSFNNKAVTVGDIVGAYKSIVANGCLTIFKNNNETMGKFWQRDYFEHIIRDARSYEEICHYIVCNPETWYKDKFYVL